jgi:hypothetical protein
MIKIPDIYSFKLTFQSLLPNSINNYLFRFSGNMNINDKLEPPRNMTDDMAKSMETGAKSAADESGVTNLLDIKGQ